MKGESLTESFYYILLCLYKEPNHGYGIMQQCDSMTSGRVKIGSGTMYGAFNNMLKKGWISERVGSVEEGRKRMYELTREGRTVLIEEIDRLKELIANAERITAEA